jgi:protease-4
MEKLNKFKNILFSTTKRKVLFSLFVVFLILGFLYLYGYSIKENNCNITGINLHGQLLSYIPLHSENDSSSDFNYDSFSSENIVESIKQANNNENIKAIILEIDSRGGSPIGGHEISFAVKNSEKPVIGLIRSMGASASYLAVSGADKIFASNYSDVGGIGITMSYLSNVAKNKKDGYTFEQLSVGKFKDSGSSDKPLTKEERNLFMRDTNILYENFIKEVSENRNIPLEEVRKNADGSTVLGEKAKELGLIDEIGGLPEVEQYLKETIGEKPNICWQ